MNSILCFRSSKPKEPKEKKYVIPLITQNNWRKPVKDKDGTDKTDKPEPTGDGMESQAVQELIEGMGTNFYVTINCMHFNASELLTSMMIRFL